MQDITNIVLNDSELCIGTQATTKVQHVARINMTLRRRLQGYFLVSYPSEKPKPSTKAHNKNIKYGSNSELIIVYNRSKCFKILTSNIRILNECL